MGETNNSKQAQIENLTIEKIKVVLTLLFSVYCFVASLEGIKSGFKLIFAQWQSNILNMVTGETAPITGLALGMLSTALVQSSSAVVAATMMSMSGMVAGGLSLEKAVQFGVPMILGANVGTSITNTIVAFGVERGMTEEEFRDTIPGVIVDDVYEILTISLLFTLELAFGFLSKLVLKMGDIYQRVLNVEDLLARFETSIIDIIVERPIIDPLKEALVGLVGIKVTGILFFIIWFLVIIYSLNMISKALERIIDLQWEDQVKAAFKNPVRGFFTGFTITFLVGSSSIGTSLIIPFIATKVVDLKGAYPYLVGCNIATTMDLSQIYGYIAGGLTGFILGTAHILLNIMAVILWFVSPLRFIPIKIAEAIGSRIAGNKNAALSLVLWIIGIFFVVPILVIVFMG